MIHTNMTELYIDNRQCTITIISNNEYLCKNRNNNNNNNNNYTQSPLVFNNLLINNGGPNVLRLKALGHTETIATTNGNVFIAVDCNSISQTNNWT